MGSVAIAPAHTGQHRRLLRNYLLDARLQLRYALVALVMSATVATVLGLLIYEQSAQTSRQIIERLNAMTWLDAASRAALIGELRSDDRRLVLVMVGAGIGLAAVLFAYLIVMTHRVAGPAHRLRSYFDDLSAGRLPRVRMLRPGDQFATFVERLRDTLDVVSGDAREDVLLCERFVELCEGAGDPSTDVRTAIEGLRALIQERTTFLGPSTRPRTAA